METVSSKDGTRIAYGRTGRGEPVILVAGAFSYRKYSGQVKLAELLSQHFTVFSYDRRGRGDSGDSGDRPPYRIDETAKFKLDEMLHADALVLGKNTYNIFASSWPSMSGELADQMKTFDTGALLLRYEAA